MRRTKTGLEALAIGRLGKRRRINGQRKTPKLRRPTRLLQGLTTSHWAVESSRGKVEPLGSQETEEDFKRKKASFEEISQRSQDSVIFNLLATSIKTAVQHDLQVFNFRSAVIRPDDQSAACVILQCNTLMLVARVSAFAICLVSSGPSATSKLTRRG
jgi:hypothetical protein